MTQFNTILTGYNNEGQKSVLMCHDAVLCKNTGRYLLL